MCNLEELNVFPKGLRTQFLGFSMLRNTIRLEQLRPNHDSVFTWTCRDLFDMHEEPERGLVPSRSSPEECLVGILGAHPII